MEPFFLRCETCQARLRVRDERFLGQVQSCPKCGSMVQILAPAGWLAAGETVAEPAPVEIAAASTPTILSRVVGSMHTHAASWVAGTATALVACALVGVYTLGGNEEVATTPLTAPIVSTPVASAPTVEDVAPAAESIEVAQQEPALQEEVATPPSAESEPLPTTAAPIAEEVAAVEETATAIEPIAQAATEPEPTATEPLAASEKPRTLTLEPAPPKPTPIESAQPEAPFAEYPPAVEVETNEAPAKPTAAPAPSLITNFKDRLALPIDSIDLPTMRIGEFVNLMSTMTAIPIKLDPKVLGDVGMSSHSTVTVQGENTTAGQLLARVLKEHKLTCVPGDGALVVVKAKQ